MQTNPYQAYVESEILTAGPVKLVQLLYRGAVEAVTEARAKLAQRDIKGRSSAVNKAIEIIAELSTTLDHEKGGALSARLASLYDYMQRQLIEGNSSQTDPPLAEVERLLNILAEAWLSVETPQEIKLARGGAAERYAGVPADYEPLSCAC